MNEFKIGDIVKPKKAPFTAWGSGPIIRILTLRAGINVYHVQFKGLKFAFLGKELEGIHTDRGHKLTKIFK